jgi:esterase/lipase
VPLDGAIVGRGPVAVVLLHEYPGPMYDWWPYAVYLAHHGVQALLFDFRCLGLSSCPPRARADPVADVAGAMRVLRSRGARSIALVGASLGGVVAVIAGARLNPAAIVDLSGERDLTGLLPGRRLSSCAAAAQLRVPALFAVARDDHYVRVADMRAIYGHAHSQVKHLVVLPTGSGHGWDLLQTTGGTWTRLASKVLSFVTNPRMRGTLELMTSRASSGRCALRWRLKRNQAVEQSSGEHPSAVSENAHIVAGTRRAVR